MFMYHRADIDDTIGIGPLIFWSVLNASLLYLAKHCSFADPVIILFLNLSQFTFLNHTCTNQLHGVNSCTSWMHKR